MPPVQRALSLVEISENKDVSNDSLFLAYSNHQGCTVSVACAPALHVYLRSSSLSIDVFDYDRLFLCNYVSPGDSTIKRSDNGECPVQT